MVKKNKNKKHKTIYTYSLTKTFMRFKWIQLASTLLPFIFSHEPNFYNFHNNCLPLSRSTSLDEYIFSHFIWFFGFFITWRKWNVPVKYFFIVSGKDWNEFTKFNITFIQFFIANVKINDDNFIMRQKQQYFNSVTTYLLPFLYIKLESKYFVTMIVLHLR